MNFMTPFAKARGLGSAKEGSHHWWAQRISAVALVPLTLWFGLAVALLPGASHAQVVGWISAPWNTVLLIALIVAGFYHAILGMQVVIEDYVHASGIKIASLLAMKLILGFMGLASILAIFRIVFL